MLLREYNNNTYIFINVIPLLSNVFFVYEKHKITKSTDDSMNNEIEEENDCY